MASITIRNLDDRLKARLRVRAAKHGKSMEDEAREILRTTLAEPTGPGEDLATTVGTRFAAIGGFDLEPQSRDPIRDPPDLEQ